MYTPSKRTETRPSLGRWGVGKDFRYQPMPPTVQAVAALPRLRPLLKGPISVGQVHLAPCQVIEGRVLGAGRVSTVESPAVIKALFAMFIGAAGWGCLPLC